MTISVFQVDSVIKAYMKNMKTKIRQIKDSPGNNSDKYGLHVSMENLKNMMYDRLREHMREKLKKDV